MADDLINDEPFEEKRNRLATELDAQFHESVRIEALIRANLAMQRAGDSS